MGGQGTKHQQQQLNEDNCPPTFGSVDGGGASALEHVQRGQDCLRPEGYPYRGVLEWHLLQPVPHEPADNVLQYQHAGEGE
ncbi:hypothetical protein AB0N24_00575 [Arthrobacter sp. NPDC093128]|uniref:hypothetical protein n=1 Tax=Arthrobacter sp. NPDC093128 TaxID=3154979 RepID=UPI003430DD80